MSRSFSPPWLAPFAFLVLATCTPPGRAAAPPPPRRVLHAVAHAGHAWTTYRTFGNYWIRAVPLSGPGGGVKIEGDASNTAPQRWHIGHGSLWVGTTTTSLAFYPRPSVYYCVSFFARYPTDKLLKGDKLTDAEKDGHLHGVVKTCGHYFGFDIMPGMIRFAAVRAGIGFYPVICSDTVATGPASVRQFVLSNIRFTQTGATLRDGISVSEEDAETPVWSMVAYTFREKEDAEHGWRKDFTLEVSFREPFTALVVGDDYYFLTDSGSVYRAPVTAKKGTRRVTRVWDGRRRPVVALVEDADAGRAFLFVGPQVGGGRPAYFTPSASPELVAYDPADLPKIPRDPKLDKPGMQENAMALEALRYPRMLVALKKIKGDAPAKEGDKK